MNDLRTPFDSTRRRPFVGRDAERAAFEELMDRAAAGEGGLVLVSGEPGVGKSRFTEEVAERAQARGCATFVGHCDDIDRALPYGPFVEVFEAVARALSPRALRALLGDAAPEIARIVPDIGRVVPAAPAPVHLAPEQDRRFLFNRVCDVLERLAAERPLLIVLDDLHRADASTALLLRHLAPRLKQMPLLVLGTLCETELEQEGHVAGALEELHRRRLANRLTLKALSMADIGEMLRSPGRAAPPAAVTGAIYRATEGNPFFIEEVYSHLLDEGRLIDEHGRWRTDLVIGESDVPDSIRLAVERRLQRLGPDARDVLAHAAIIGTVFDARMLEAVGVTNYDTVVAAIEEAERARLVRRRAQGDATSACVFGHELVRQTLALSISAPRRQRLHADVARAIAGNDGDAGARVAEIANHLYQAGPSADAERTVSYLARAGHQAVVAAAYDDAARHFERAVHILEAGEGNERRRCELVLATGAALWSSGDLEGAGGWFLQAADLAKRLDEGTALAAAALRMGEGWGWAPNQVLTQLLEDALEALPDYDDPLRARVMARLAVELQSMPGDSKGRREELATHAVAMARRAGDPATLGYALGCWGSVYLEVADARERLDVATEALAIADAGYWATAAHQQRIVALTQLGDFDAVDAAIDDLAALAHRGAAPFIRWEMLRFRAMRALLDGRLEDADGLITEHFALARDLGQFPGAMLTYSVQTLLLRSLQGRVGELEGPARANVDRFQQGPDAAAWKAALAFVYAQTGDEAEARRALELFSIDELRDLRRQRASTLTASLLTDVCDFLGDAERARVLYDVLLPFAERHLTTRSDGCLGAAGRHLGLLTEVLGMHEDADGHFARALAMNEAAGARPALAQTRYDLARVLLARRPARRARARELLEQALETAESLGLVGLAAHARALLEGTTAAVGHRFPAGLSARETEVLALLAEGKSSREIGEELVLAVRTVERHITNIYRKIDAHNRAQATAFAIKHQLAGR